MKISVMSDLHLEFEPADDAERDSNAILGRAPEALCVAADLVILAGDIHTKARGPAWAHDAFPGLPVVMLGGNHEPYNASLYADIARNRVLAAEQGSLPDGTQHVTWLERETFTWISPAGEAVRIIGATLWTDFELFGEDSRPSCERLARQVMNDFNIVKIRGVGGETKRFDPIDARRLHRLSVDYIRDELARPFVGLSIVATHHAPSMRSVPEEFRDTTLSAAYASDLEALILETSPDLWVHGHTHTSLDYAIGATRVVCNPRGYWPQGLNLAFRWGLAVELSVQSQDATSAGA